MPEPRIRSRQTFIMVVAAVAAYVVLGEFASGFVDGLVAGFTDGV